MDKLYSRKTEQYDGKPPPSVHPDFIIWKGYPACRKHGHLLRYAWDVWRCLECGWAITMAKASGDKPEGLSLPHISHSPDATNLESG